MLFLLQKETGFEKMDSFYEFAAHNFGPFSKEVYEALDFLEGCELIQVKERVHSSYYANVGEVLLLQEIANAGEIKLLQEISEREVDEVKTGNAIGVAEKLFTLTENGHKVAQKLSETIEKRRPKDIDGLKSIVRRYGKLPLNQLIRYVYRQYPEMTVKSIHPEAKRLPAKHS